MRYVIYIRKECAYDESKTEIMFFARFDGLLMFTTDSLDRARTYDSEAHAQEDLNRLRYNNTNFQCIRTDMLDVVQVLET